MLLLLLCVLSPPAGLQYIEENLSIPTESPQEACTFSRWHRVQHRIQICTPPLQACKYIEENLAIPTESLGAGTLMSAARTAMSSKIVGAESDFFAQIVVDAGGCSNMLSHM